MDLELILTVVAVICLSLAIGGGGYVALREAGARSKRDERLTSGLAGAAGGPKADSAVMKSVRKLGDRMALQDPAQLTVLRQRLMLAGFVSKEAVAIYLGARAVCLGVAVLAGAPR